MLNMIIQEICHIRLQYLQRIILQQTWEKRRKKLLHPGLKDLTAPKVDIGHLLIDIDCK